MEESPWFFMQDNEAMSQADFKLCFRIARMTREKKLPEMRKANIRTLLLASIVAKQSSKHDDARSHED